MSAIEPLRRSPAARTSAGVGAGAVVVRRESLRRAAASARRRAVSRA